MSPEQRYFAGHANPLTRHFTVNMIWLGVLTDRVPILPPFAPFHIEQWDTAPAVDFGDVFDLPRFREAARISVIQWSDVKVGKEVDQVGCW